MTGPRCWSDGRTGAPLSHPEAMDRLAAARVVLLGEQHDRAEDHRWQALVIAGLAARHGGLAVGLEMLPRSAQPALDDWSQGRIDRATFLEQSRWAEVWGFEPALYAPVLDVCRDLRLPMQGLNVARPVVSLVGRDGWDALAPEERRWLTPARAATPEYRRYLFAVTGGARPGRTARTWDDPAFDRFVRAQQVWDRAFACALAEALRPGMPAAGVIGRGHLEFGHGTPGQLADLGIDDVLVALPAPPGAPAPGGGGNDAIADLVFHHPGRAAAVAG